MDQDIVKLILERKDAGMKKPSIRIDDRAEIIPRAKDLGSDHTAVGEADGWVRGRRSRQSQTVIVRPSSRAGPPEQSSRAIKLKACKGKKGCEFVQCVEEAMGKVPKNLMGLKDRCSIEKGYI